MMFSFLFAFFKIFFHLRFRNYSDDTGRNYTGNSFVSIQYLLRESMELISPSLSKNQFSPNSTMRITDPQQVDNRAVA